MANGMRFARIHGRIVPIRSKGGAGAAKAKPKEPVPYKKQTTGQKAAAGAGRFAAGAVGVTGLLGYIGGSAAAFGGAIGIVEHGIHLGATAFNARKLQKAGRFGLQYGNTATAQAAAFGIKKLAHNAAAHARAMGAYGKFALGGAAIAAVSYGAMGLAGRMYRSVNKKYATKPRAK